MRRKIAVWLRRKADRIDPSSAPRSMGAYANLVPGRGWVFTSAGYSAPTSRMGGIPLWYMTEDYDRAFTDEVAPHSEERDAKYFDRRMAGHVESPRINLPNLEA